MKEGPDVQFGRFRQKGQGLHDDDNAKGVPGAMADKLRKLLFAFETADSLDPSRPVSRLETASAQGRPEGLLEPDRLGELAADTHL